MAADYIDWPGVSGRTYRYFQTPSIAATALRDEPGNYMFVKETPTSWVPIYIGICDSFKVRLPNHERLAEAVRAGATHVLTRVNIVSQARQYEERDLIARWNPRLNTQHRTTG